LRGEVPTGAGAAAGMTGWLAAGAACDATSVGGVGCAVGCSFAIAILPIKLSLHGNAFLAKRQAKQAHTPQQKSFLIHLAAS